MGKKKHITPVTVFAQLRERYNETHSEFLSQEKMGKIVHVSKATISRIENGSFTPTDDVLKAYSEFFNVSMDYLKPTEQPINTIPANAVPVAELGITEDVIATYKRINEISNHNENIGAVLNSLIGNDLDTVILLQNILSYLVEQVSCSNNRISEAFFIDCILHYINNIMKPQLQKVIKNNIIWQETLLDINAFDE